MEIVFTKNTVFGRDIYKAGDKAEFNEKEAKIILPASARNSRRLKNRRHLQK